MENTDNIITSSIIKDYKIVLVNKLTKVHNSPIGFITKFFGKKDALSKKNAFIALVLLDRITSLTDNQNDYEWDRHHVEQDDARFKTLFEISSPKNFWNADRYPLLEYLFGKRIAPFVKDAWAMIPKMMYQSGYSRRSFRGSDLESIYFTIQLNFIIDLIHENIYDFSFEDIAIWSNKIDVNSFSTVYAAAISAGDESIKNQFIDTLTLKHERGTPSRVVIKAMLLSQDQECWVAVEKLLLSAQRQEGLRQTILECLDETSIGAMKHIIKVILDHKLTRFSSVIRAVDVWAGFGWEGEKETTVRRFLELAHLYLEQPEKIKQAVLSNDNAEVYMALWAQGVRDISGCFPLIDSVLKGSNEKISLALYFVDQVSISTFSIKYGKIYLNHSDPVVVCQATALVNVPVFIGMLEGSEKKKLYSQLEVTLEMLPKKTTVSKPRVFSWLTFSIGKEFVLDLMINLLNLKKEADMDKIIPHFENLAVVHRESVTSSIFPGYSMYNYGDSEPKGKLTKRKRDFAFSILKDRSEQVKRTAISVLSEATLSQDEIEVFEGLLTRKAADFRKLIIALIAKHGVKQVKLSTNNLLVAKSEDQRLAGLDLLLWLNKNDKNSSKWIAKRTEEFSQRSKISLKEEMVLSGLLKTSNNTTEYVAENGFGLFNPDQLPPTSSLIDGNKETLKDFRKVNDFGLSVSPIELNKALDQLGKLFLKNKEHEFTYEDWEDKKRTEIIGNAFCKIQNEDSKMTPEQKFCNYPLPEVWRQWIKDSGLTKKDIFLINLHEKFDPDASIDKEFSGFSKRSSKKVFLPVIPKLSEYEWQNPIYTILEILENRYEHPHEESIDLLSALILEIFNSVDRSILSSYNAVKTYWQAENHTWRDTTIIANLWTKYSTLVSKMSKKQFEIFWNLAQWYYNTAPTDIELNKDYIPELRHYARAFNEDLIGNDLLYWRVLKPDAIRLLTTKVAGEEYDINKEYSFLNEILENARQRILEIELIRGDSSTAVTHLAQNINRLYGTGNFVNLLKSLGKDTLNRGYIYNWGGAEYNRKEILSTLLKNCFPSPSCEQAEFDRTIKNAKITDKRLSDAATYSPQWLPFVAKHLGWKDMESAVWWLHAHTNGHHSSQTESEISKYSSVEIAEFNDGAVDIDWFNDTYKSIGADKWKTLYNSAKYISDGGGHRRGLLYADVILKKIKIKEITERIESKRNQDYLRVYGVIPLSKASPSQDVLIRYQFLQKFKKESKQFGSQRQASETIAVRIAMENLARTAGFSDPMRLQWAMETKEAQEIIENSKDIEFGETKVFLEIDEYGKSSIFALKAGKKLKSVPAKYKKEKELIKLKADNKTLREQYRRTKKSLETAMINGDVFSQEEIKTLFTHPVVAPMLKKLILISGEKIGFWKDGKLITSEGLEIDFDKEIKIAHSVDLFDSGTWSTFQKHCFEHKLVQPFKQIFRELYVPTEDELKEKSISRRYAGHQLQPRKTIALLKGQSWTVDYEEGLQKVHHKQNIISRMYAMADWFSPSDIEPPTIETIGFFGRKDGKRIPFKDIDKRIFSETMRDIDLVVSVAHVGGVDPEASQSSIELRSVIIKETCKLFKLTNVSLSGNHVNIKGELGDYSVHIGSGVCHKVASASLSIIPVHSQHRGRMFLPFIDDDPKTAEIISKVLLLAKDKNIKDPTILSQL